MNTILVSQTDLNTEMWSFIDPFLSPVMITLGKLFLLYIFNFWKQKIMYWLIHSYVNISFLWQHYINHYISFLWQGGLWFIWMLTL